MFYLIQEIRKGIDSLIVIFVLNLTMLMVYLIIVSALSIAIANGA